MTTRLNQGKAQTLIITHWQVKHLPLAEDCLETTIGGEYHLRGQQT